MAQVEERTEEPGAQGLVLSEFELRVAGSVQEVLLVVDAERLRDSLEGPERLRREEQHEVSLLEPRHADARGHGVFVLVRLQTAPKLHLQLLQRLGVTSARINKNKQTK